jgi:hypothetical protein
LFVSIVVVFSTYQDALFFFRAFFNDVSSRFASSSDSNSAPAENSLPSVDPAPLAVSPKHVAVDSDRQPVMTVGGETTTMHSLPNQITDPEEMLLIFSEIAEAASARGDNIDSDSLSQGSNHSSQTSSTQTPVFFKLVISTLTSFQNIIFRVVLP